MIKRDTTPHTPEPDKSRAQGVGLVHWRGTAITAGTQDGVYGRSSNVSLGKQHAIAALHMHVRTIRYDTSKTRPCCSLSLFSCTRRPRRIPHNIISQRLHDATTETRGHGGAPLPFPESPFLPHSRFPPRPGLCRIPRVTGVCPSVWVLYLPFVFGRGGLSLLAVLCCVAGLSSCCCILSNRVGGVFPG